VSEEKTTQEREEYLMKLLKGKKKKGNAETEIKKKQRASEEIEITVDEVERQISKLKKRKTPGRDEVQNEAWMYGTGRSNERRMERRGIPVDWREGVICLICQKGEKIRITLLNTVVCVNLERQDEERLKKVELSSFQKGKGYH
jgi:hypothetical protein